MVVGHLHVTPQARTDAQTDVRALVVHRVLGIHTHQSALGVLSIECTLRASEDIHAVEHVEVVIEGGLRHQGDIVVVDTHGGVVDARAYTSYI